MWNNYRRREYAQDKTNKQNIMKMHSAWIKNIQLIRERLSLGAISTRVYG